MGVRKRPKSDFLVLIIDDDKDFLTSMAFWFKTQGYRIVTASSGEEGLNVIRETVPNLVFLDYMMPGIDGIETLERIRKNHLKLPVVMLSAYAHEKMRVEAYKLGANGVFDKSVDFYNAENLLNSLVRVMSKEKKGGARGRKGLWWIVVGVILAAVLGGISLVKTASPQVCFDDVCARTELAVTDKERLQGLMHRSQLPEGQGMLFVFPKSGFWNFWMKDTYISLDIIWLNEKKEVVEVIHGAMPAAGQLRPPSLGGHTLSRFVLEVPAGFAKRHGIKKGSRAQFRGIFFKA